MPTMPTHLLHPCPLLAIPFEYPSNYFQKVKYVLKLFDPSYGQIEYRWFQKKFDNSGLKAHVCKKGADILNVTQSKYLFEYE